MAVTNINIDSQILTFANLAAFPVTGTVKTIYIAEDTDISYYWDGAAYQDITIDTSGLVPAGLITTSGLTMNTARLLGRGTAGVGAVEEIVIGSGLTLTGTTLSAAGGGITIGTTAIASGAVGRVLFEGAGNVVQQSSNFFWDNTNGRLGIRVATPTASLEVLGAAPSGTSQSFAVHNSTGNNNAFVVTDDTTIGMGAVPASGVRLDVRAQGGLSTDIAFRVRNSADTANLIEIAGNNTMTFLSSGGKIVFSQDTVNLGSVISLRRDFINQEIIRLDGTNNGGITINPLNDGSTKSVAIRSVANGISMWTTGLDSHNFQIKNSFHNLFHVVGNPNLVTATFRLGTNASNTNFFNVHGRNAGGTGLTTDPIFTVNSAGNFGNGAISFGTNAQFVFAQGNGVAPTSSPANAYQQYSADIVANNAAPHFRTGNGDVVRLYRVGGWGLPTGSFTRTTFDTTTVTLQQLAERVAALIQDLRDNHQLLKA